MNKIYLSCDIDEAAFKEFCEQLDDLETNGIDEVEIVLNSAGGNAMDGMAVANRILQSKVSKIQVVVYGLVASSATVILAAGDERIMCQNALAMVHEDRCSAKNITSSQQIQEGKNAEFLENHWCQIFEELTGTKKEVWRKIQASGDTYLTPQKCLELGLITRII